MDWVAVREKASVFIKKYRYVMLVLLAGIVLMCLPNGGNEKKTQVSEIDNGSNCSQETPEEKLRKILSHIEGAGKVEVLLTTLAGEETVYQSDEDSENNADSSSIRMETVIVTNEQRSQQGLVKQVNPPVYLGAVIVCQGADRASVRLAIVEAVANATGLSTDRISVLKMK